MTTSSCRGFVYATAVMGVTGARTATTDLAGAAGRPDARASAPTCRSGWASASATATRPPRWRPTPTAVIVGSAFVRTLLDHADDEAAGLRRWRALTEDLAPGAYVRALGRAVAPGGRPARCSLDRLRQRRRRRPAPAARHRARPAVRGLRRRR